MALKRLINMKFKNNKVAKDKRFNELKNNITLNDCSNTSFELIKTFFNNTNYILKTNKLTYNKIIDYYKAKGIRINKAYLYSLSKCNKYKTCNTLMLAFIANYLNIPLINLLTIDYTIKDKLNVVKPVNNIAEF